MLPIAFSPTDPRCHGNEIWDKIGYNSVTVVIGLAALRKKSGYNSVTVVIGLATLRNKSEAQYLCN